MSGVRVLRELGRRQGHVPSALMPVVFTSVLGLEGLGRGLNSSAFGETVYTISQTPQVWLDHQVLEDRGALSTSWDAVEELFPGRPSRRHVRGLPRDYWKGLPQVTGLWHARQTTMLPARQASDPLSRQCYRNAAARGHAAHGVSCARPNLGRESGSDRARPHSQLSRAF
jgi:pyochelin synthetase